MKQILIVSVGGSPDLILDAIGKLAPDFVYFLCSTGSAGSDTSVLGEIAPKAGLPEARFHLERVQSAHVLRDVTAACTRIEADLEERFAGEEIHVTANYTGGTRTMSAGLVALAQRRGWEAQVTERAPLPWCGPVSRLELRAVTAFSKLDLAFERGLNVIVGENGTGKTHILKCMYALLRVADEAATNQPEVATTERRDKLQRVLGGDVRGWFAMGDEPSVVCLECQSDESRHFSRTEPQNGPVTWQSPPRARTGALFFPSREVLAMFPGFVKAYEGRELSFDETYYDICRELGGAPLREPSPEFAAVLSELEAVLGGRVRLELGGFVIDTERGTIPAPLAAEGHRKLAVLAHLIATGALTTDSVLFWDEPEANLNPKLVRAMARLLRILARTGVQIFLATHDYLLTRELSLESEYHPEEVETAFFSLRRSSDDGSVVAERANLWGNLEHNPIFDAYAAHSARELELFGGSEGQA